MAMQDCTRFLGKRVRYREGFGTERDPYFFVTGLVVGHFVFSDDDFSNKEDFNYLLFVEDGYEDTDAVELYLSHDIQLLES